MSQEPITIYDRIGGYPTISRIVEAFYPRVQRDPLLAPIFPDDIRPVMEKQRLFLTQFFGGPPLYTRKYGPPRMRARHLPFPITPQRAEAWLRCMAKALDEVGIEGKVREEMWGRLYITAGHMVNQPGEDQDPSSQ
ncbi:MAG: globin [Firmicutes bacterium]|uniref:Hemoglobin n=1 Tax=Melghirimyces thermohalophilus TaxID=1236220 RepID=A0A1G6IHD1_9BACL|nr:globin [Melghirimyces thermohalophilus]MDA8354576.1 globin [Bacillota bacterium]SDC05810.1 hemoglobin [Melghirimyces thermohalophilus]